MITSNLVVQVIAISTLATIIFIGLGFLPRPSRATALWSAVFAISMVAAYVWLAQAFLFPEQLRALGSGLAVAPVALLWSGLRAYCRHDRQFVPLAVAWLLIAPTALVVSTFVGVYDLAFRAVYILTAVFAGLIVRELMRMGPQLRDEALPLMAASMAYIVFAVIIAINAVLLATGAFDPADSLEFVRTINMIGTTVYTVCALITTLLLTTRTHETSRSARTDFERVARNRLDRARVAEDTWWALLDVRLDDPDDIRMASSTAAFNAVLEKLALDVDSVFPADADIERISGTRFLVLLPRPEGGVRDLISALLERVSADGDRAFSIRLSASVGWAAVTAVGYDLEQLTAAASQAAVTAHDAGGDRWERVRGARD